MRICDYCGRENSDEAVSCASCASELQEDAPVAKRTKAGFGIRALARILDVVFICFITAFTRKTMIAVFILGYRAGFNPYDWLYRMQGLSLFMLFFDFLASVLYHTFCEGLCGATLGKLCCGIRVVSEDGSPSTLRGALIRTIRYHFFDGWFFGAVAYSAMKKSPLNQRAGDIQAKTIVIKNDEVAPASERSTQRLIFALGLGVTSYGVMEAVGVLLKIWETRGRL